mmetsp:Transcript_27694/g.38155  ORF Transcript_27694/g.38155 Transcript_27694/m.38155 type:complete len:334 (-) Transcript_27694:1036-2037(-)
MGLVLVMKRLSNRSCPPPLDGMLLTDSGVGPLLLVLLMGMLLPPKMSSRSSSEGAAAAGLAPPPTLPPPKVLLPAAAAGGGAAKEVCVGVLASPLLLSSKAALLWRMAASSSTGILSSNSLRRPSQPAPASSTVYSVLRCCSSSDMDVRNGAMRSTIDCWHCDERRTDSFTSALMMSALVGVSTLCRCRHLPSWLMTSASGTAGKPSAKEDGTIMPPPLLLLMSSPDSGGQSLTSCAPYSPTHHTATCSRPSCEESSTRLRYRRCVAWACSPSACAMKMMAVRGTDSSVRLPAMVSIVITVSTFHFLLGEYFSTIWMTLETRFPLCSVWATTR